MSKTYTPEPLQASTYRQSRPHLRSKLVRIALASVITLTMLVASLSGLAVWLYVRTLPQTEGTLSVSGLMRPVAVVRDQWGTPHITAANLHDLAFSQGYITSQDRL